MHKNLCSSLGQKTVDHKIFQLEVAHAVGQMASRSEKSGQSSSYHNSQKGGQTSVEQKSVHCEHPWCTAVVDDGDIILSQESMISGVPLSSTMPMSAPQSGRRGSSTPKQSGPHWKDGSSVRQNCYERPPKRSELQECGFQKSVIRTACLSSKGNLYRQCRTCKVRTK